jgi:membrane peptidoglycan carboxypeptidase
MQSALKVPPGFILINRLKNCLKVEEAAMFVGMLQNPSYYNPRRFEQRTRDRRATVLRKLMEQGAITEAQFSAVKDNPIKLDFHPESANDGLAPYFRMVVAEELKKWAKENKKQNGEEYNIYTDGLKIYTTINTRMQRYAEEAANTASYTLSGYFQFAICRWLETLGNKSRNYIFWKLLVNTQTAGLL